MCRFFQPISKTFRYSSCYNRRVIKADTIRKLKPVHFSYIFVFKTTAIMNVTCNLIMHFGHAASFYDLPLFASHSHDFKNNAESFYISDTQLFNVKQRENTSFIKL